MPDGSPENDGWLNELVGRSTLLAEPSLRRHWQRLIPWLPTPARYELAAILLDFEQRPT
jgi:hypothetical protein